MAKLPNKGMAQYGNKQTPTFTKCAKAIHSHGKCAHHTCSYLAQCDMPYTTFPENYLGGLLLERTSTRLHITIGAK